MARSRNIKPGFFLNTRLSECSIYARMLFIGLWCIADRKGRLQDCPKKIKVQILPYDKANVDKLLAELDNRKFITRYTVGGEGFIEIPNFLKHQNPHCKEAESTIPDPPSSTQEPEKHQTSTVQEPEKHHTSPADSLNLIPDSLKRIPDSLIPDSRPDPEPEPFDFPFPVQKPDPEPEPNARTGPNPDPKDPEQIKVIRERYKSQLTALAGGMQFKGGA